MATDDCPLSSSLSGATQFDDAEGESSPEALSSEKFWYLHLFSQSVMELLCSTALNVKPCLSHLLLVYTSIQSFLTQSFTQRSPVPLPVSDSVVAAADTEMDKLLGDIEVTETEGPQPRVRLCVKIGTKGSWQNFQSHPGIIIEGTRDVELESQLKILNKTPIKSIQTEVGDVFDCIDINMQPSLDHPLLKNHVIKTRPIPHLITTMVNDDYKGVSLSSTSSSSSAVKPSSRIARLQKLNCPDGTVPIRRTNKEDLIRAKLFSQSQLVHSNNVKERDDLENPSQGQFLSIVKTKKDSGIDYLGIAAGINIQNPPVTKDQISTAQLWIENGPKEELNSLQAGWMIAPSLYGDNKTRLFSKWQIDGSNKSEGCYNILCPGFVQIDNAHPVDMVLNQTIPYGDKGHFVHYAIKVSISQDGGKNWWLDVQDIKIGYWPAELGFSHLTRGSPLVAWGGLAEKLGGEETTVPPTGNGKYPQSFIQESLHCFMIQMKVIPVKTLYWEDPTYKIMDTFATKEECSKIRYFGDKAFGFGHTISFGGPGGNC